MFETLHEKIVNLLTRMLASRAERQAELIYQRILFDLVGMENQVRQAERGRGGDEEDVESRVQEFWYEAVERLIEASLKEEFFGFPTLVSLSFQRVVDRLLSYIDSEQKVYNSSPPTQ